MGSRKNWIVKILLGITILFISFGPSSLIDTFNHSIVVFVLVIFWVVTSYFFFPVFFKKYKFYILGLYVAIIAYFLIVKNLGRYDEFNRQWIFNLLLLPVPIFLGMWIYKQWKWFKSIKAEKTKAELDLLKTQVNPHFLFNTLNNLHALTVKQSPKAPEIVLKLSEMLRYTIYEGKNDRVALSEEISYLKNYIALHQIRYRKNVIVDFEHDCIQSDTIAPLLFIILLENAFKHGVEKLAEEAFIKINLVSREEQIDFSIENNFDVSVLKNDKGIGLDNLKSRLNLIYPKQHSLVINESSNTYKVRLKIRKQ